ncbi:mandelate racemase/muconate lactonizing enzyme family protein [Phyllobacterium endophyticum]|nr:mandelate racemase/muconate lactonizing enzyme family protein [Phyllobacterium endophyticum]MBB3236722.1 L-alanine-DL-glutamate epimerase-like enolase superfamily enzyme [Phyllobacterium endophyticum]
MKIVNASVKAYRLPPASLWEDATNKVESLEFVIVELVSDTGATGVGVSYTVDIGGTAIKALIDDYLIPLVIGMDVRNYENIWNRLSRQSRRLGLGVNSMAIAAIDIAVWDLLGKLYQQPIFRLLGGAREQIASYISEINLSADDTVDDLVRRVDEYKAQKYDTVKIKIGKPDFSEDLERIAKVKERLGSAGRLLVDLNQKWSSAEAIQKGAQLDKFDLGWIEEPMMCQDIAGHAALKRSIRTPIALGESLYSRQQFLEYLRADAVDVVQADVAFVGGITEWHKIAHLANAFGKQVAPHYMMELSLQLLCGVQNSFMLENVIGGSFTELGLLEEPIVVKNGVGVPSNRPGHGLIFNRSALEMHELSAEKIKSNFSGGSK